MSKSIRHWLSAAFIAGAALAPPVLASTVIDFEGDALAGLYDDGQSFSQAGFTMTQGHDFGIVGTAQDLGGVAPGGNSSQYYFNSNDGFLSIKAQGGLAFSLDGFSAAFVPLIPNPGQSIVIVAIGVPSVGNAFGVYFPLGNTGGGSTSFPFLTYSGAVDFAAFTNLTEVQFFACSLTASNVCVDPTLNNAQFALDDVLVTAVPEPATAALAVLGLAGVLLAARRRRVR